jgi:hypothetical protein
VIDEWDRPLDGAASKPVRMHFHERVARFEGGLDSAPLREAPRYREMLQFACERLQWNLSEFDVYRLRIEYPLHHTTVQLRYFVADE